MENSGFPSEKAAPVVVFRCSLTGFLFTRCQTSNRFFFMEGLFFTGDQNVVNLVYDFTLFVHILILRKRAFVPSTLFWFTASLL